MFVKQKYNNNNVIEVILFYIAKGVEKVALGESFADCDICNNFYLVSVFVRAIYDATLL